MILSSASRLFYANSSSSSCLSFTRIREKHNSRSWLNSRQCEIEARKWGPPTRRILLCEDPHGSVVGADYVHVLRPLFGTSADFGRPERSATAVLQQYFFPLKRNVWLPLETLFFIHCFETDQSCFTKTSVTSKLNVRLS